MKKTIITVQINDFVIEYLQVINMYYGNIIFNEIPEIGFAHQHYSLDYGARYGKNKSKCIEIAYVNSGAIRVKFDKREFYAEKGDILVLFRHLTIQTETSGGEMNSHCTVLAEFSEYDFSLVEGDMECQGFVIPFVTKGCKECEEIGKRIYKMASAKADTDAENELSLSVEFLSILKQLHEINKRKNTKSRAYKSISDKVCAYVGENVEESITLAEISAYIGKSPNHISHAFKREKGITITEYINIQKVKLIKSLMQNGKSFKETCILAGLCDETYGYRLFKRYTGITPKEYKRITTIKK